VCAATTSEPSRPSRGPAPRDEAPALPLLLTAGAGVLAFAAAGLLIHPASGGAESAVAIDCPFRAMTGLPCPLCGATRSLGLFVQGNGSFLDYNPVWVVVVALVVLGALLGVLRPAIRGRAARAPTALKVAAGVLVVAAAWSVALAHRAAIVAA